MIAGLRAASLAYGAFADYATHIAAQRSTAHPGAAQCDSSAAQLHTYKLLASPTGRQSAFLHGMVSSAGPKLLGTAAAVQLRAQNALCQLVLSLLLLLLLRDPAVQHPRNCAAAVAATPWTTISSNNHAVKQVARIWACSAPLRCSVHEVSNACCLCMTEGSVCSLQR